MKLTSDRTGAGCPSPAYPSPSPPSRNDRVMENQGLVHQVSRGFRGRGVAMEDLIQFGNIGLMRAAEKFEPARGLKFSTYAVYWIRQAIYKGIANTSRPIRVPLHARRDAAAVHRGARAMEAETGVRPWLSEVLDAMEARGESAPARRQRLLRAAEADRAQFGVNPLDLLEVETAAGDSPLSACIAAEHREQLGLALERLGEEHRRVLTWRYGLGGSPPLAIMATAALLGIGWRAALRLEQQAIAELKRLLNR